MCCDVAFLFARHFCSVESNEWIIWSDLSLLFIGICIGRSTAERNNCNTSFSRVNIADHYLMRTQRIPRDVRVTLLRIVKAASFALWYVSRITAANAKYCDVHVPFSLL